MKCECEFYRGHSTMFYIVKNHMSNSLLVYHFTTTAKIDCFKQLLNLTFKYQTEALILFPDILLLCLVQWVAWQLYLSTVKHSLKFNMIFPSLFYFSSLLLLILITTIKACKVTFSQVFSKSQRWPLATANLNSWVKYVNDVYFLSNSF